MRRLIPIAAVTLLACGGDSRPSSSAAGAPSAPAAASRGPDAVVLRVPRTGGVARAYVYPRVDSAVWSSGTAAPAIARVLAFDDDAGSLAYVDAKGLPGRLDLRSGSVAGASRVKFASLASADGRALFGIDKGIITRLTPTDSWPFTPPVPAREVAPQPDGTLLVVGARDGHTIVWRVRPPDARLSDSVVVGPSDRSVRTRVGDRLYLVHDRELLGIRVRDFAVVPTITFAHRVRVVSPTPSGDRLYVTQDSTAALSVVDRYTTKVAQTVELPGEPGDLRMDPLGRYLLVKAARGDSAWVVALGTDRVIGSVRTAWTADLPFVAPDGAVATSQSADVVFVDGETLQPRKRVAGGAKDFWQLVLWNGFRPRAAGLDEPVTFRRPAPDSAVVNDAVDSALVGAGAASDSAARPDSAPPAARPTPPAHAAPPPARASAPPAQPAGFLVQFASFPSEEKARAAANFTIKGVAPHVAATQVGSSTIYRVVLGPFPTRAAADRAGHDAGRDFWVYEATP